MINGFLNIYKEKGMTSASVVGKVKYLLKSAGIKTKVGHFGTLDPDGEGVLPISLGRATRLFEYSLDKVKVYYTEFRFGVTTDTLDASGSVLKTCGILPTHADIEKVIPRLIGVVDQMPPAYSAKVVDGVRAYKLAREGQEVTLKPKRVTISKIEILNQLSADTFAFRITCGGGTYIRSIARDMGEALGTLAIMNYIRREQSGFFTIDKAKRLSEITPQNMPDLVVVLGDFLAVYPRVDLAEADAKCLKNGVKVPSKPLANALQTPCKCPPNPSETPLATAYFKGDLWGILAENDGKMGVETWLV